MLAASNKRCVAIINPAGAGGRTNRAWLKAAQTVKSRLQQSNYELVERFTSRPGDAVQLAAEAVAAGAAAVLAVGGDGTVHEVVNGMMTSCQQQQQQQGLLHVPPATALAILPMGTGSDFRRTFGWGENDVEAACQRITNGNRQPLDVGKVVLRCKQNNPQQPQQLQQQRPVTSMDELTSEVKYFVNIMSCGIAGLVNQILDRYKVLGSMAYNVASVAALLRYKRVDIEVCCDDGSSWQSFDDVTLLAVCNGGYWGGGMQVMPSADTSDGVMNVLAVQHMGLMDFITKGHLLKSGRYEGLPGVTVLPRCTKLTVRAAKQAPDNATTTPVGAGIAEQDAQLAAVAAASAAPLWELDGEAQGGWQEVIVELIPGALQLCV